MLGSSSYGKRLELPVTLKSFVKRLGGDTKDAAPGVSDPNFVFA
jgi:hypothetical protein